MTSYILSCVCSIFAIEMETGQLNQVRAGLLLISGALAQIYHNVPFLHSPAILWITVFWALDWILGFAMAACKRQISPTRAFFSVVKLGVYYVALAVAYGITEVQMLGHYFVSGMITAGVFGAEGASVLRKCAKISGSQMYAWFADGLDKAAIDAKQAPPASLAPAPAAKR